MWPEAGGTILSPEFLKLSRRKGCPGPQIRGIQAGGSGLRWACGSQEDLPNQPRPAFGPGATEDPGDDLRGGVWNWDTVISLCLPLTCTAPL